MITVHREPLLKELLRYVIQDEARHVHTRAGAERHFASCRTPSCASAGLDVRGRLLMATASSPTRSTTMVRAHMKRADWDRIMSDSPS